MGKLVFLDKLFDMIGKSKKEVAMTMGYWGSRWGDKTLFDEVIFPKLKDSITNAHSLGASVRIMGDIEEDELVVTKTS